LAVVARESELLHHTRQLTHSARLAARPGMLALSFSGRGSWHGAIKEKTHKVLEVGTDGSRRQRRTLPFACQTDTIYASKSSPLNKAPRLAATNKWSWGACSWIVSSIDLLAQLRQSGMSLPVVFLLATLLALGNVSRSIEAPSTSSARLVAWRFWSSVRRLLETAKSAASPRPIP